MVRPMNRKVVAYINGRRERRVGGGWEEPRVGFGSGIDGLILPVGAPLEGFGDEREPLKRACLDGADRLGITQLTRWYLCNTVIPCAKIGLTFIEAVTRGMA